MAFFSNFFGKKKESNKNFEINENDTLGNIGFKLAKTGIISIPEDDDHNSFGESLDKLVDGELPFGWYHAKKDFIKPRDNKLTELSVQASKSNDIETEIKLLREFVAFFEEYQNECKLNGECYEKYFYDRNIHDGSISGNPDFYWLNQNKERLKYLEENKDRLIEEKQSKEIALKNISQKLEEIIIKNPGILQSEIYKHFDEIIKNEISNYLYLWDKDEKIKRIKSGKTYQIYYNKKDD